MAKSETLTSEEKAQLEGLVKKAMKAQPKAAAAPAKGLAEMTISKDEFRKKGLAVMSIATMLASLTPTPKDDIVAGLLSHLFSEPDHFDQICELLSIV